MAAAAAAASGPGCSSVAAAAGAGAAGVSEWLVLRDGCMRCDADGLHSLSYHPALNAILAVTSRGTIKVIDGTSGATLQASALSGECAARRAGAGPPREEPGRLSGGGGAAGQGWGLGPAAKGGPGAPAGGSWAGPSVAAAGKGSLASWGALGVACGTSSVRCGAVLRER